MKNESLWLFFGKTPTEHLELECRKAARCNIQDIVEGSPSATMVNDDNECKSNDLVTTSAQLSSIGIVPGNVGYVRFNSL